MENQTPQLPTANSPQTMVPQPQTPLKSSKFPLLPIILSLLVILLVASTGYLYYQNMQLKNQLINYQSQTLATSTPSPVETLVQGGTLNLKTFTTKDGKYTLKYPADWTLVDNSKDVDLYGDGKVQLQQDITISKGDYKFTSRNPLAWGPNVCIFSDSIPFDGPSAKFSSFVQFDGAGGTFRRAKGNLPPEVKNNYITWPVCTKENGSNTYNNVAGFGTVSYQSPLDYDEKILQIEDQIMASFKLVN